MKFMISFHSSILNSKNMQDKAIRNKLCITLRQAAVRLDFLVSNFVCIKKGKITYHKN